MAAELFSNVLQKFIDKSPVTVMVEGLLEHILNPEKIDRCFEEKSGFQYTSERPWYVMPPPRALRW